jgi:hypothetical protein
MQHGLDAGQGRARLSSFAAIGILILRSVSLGMRKMGRMVWLLLCLPVGVVRGQQITPSQSAADQVAASQAALSAVASQAAPPVEKLLERLVDYARKYRANLPSLSCDESITTQDVRKGVVRKEVKIESTLREIRMDTGSEDFSERHHFNTVDGHAPLARFNVPYFVQGGFANALGFASNFTTDMACYEYKISSLDEGKTLRLDLGVRPNNTDATCRDVFEGYRKSVLIDAASGRITYLERTMSAKAAKDHKEAFFATMEYGPQKMGDETLWLPIRMTAHDDKGEGRMSVTYSNYHRYMAKATIVPNDAPTIVN